MAVRLGWGEPGTLFKKSICCQKCGRGALYWAKHDGQWRLHHWAMVGSMKRPDFVLHRCGFTSEGAPIHESPHPGDGTAGEVR